MLLIFTKPSFQFPIGLRVLHPCQDRFYAIAFEVLLEIVILFPIVMNAVRAKFGTMISSLMGQSHQYFSTS